MDHYTNQGIASEAARRYAPHRWQFDGGISFRRQSGRHTHPLTHPLNGPLSGTTQVSRYQKGKTNLHFTGARDSEWQWHQLGNMQVCTSLQTDNHASTSPPLSFLQAGCPSCRPTNSVKALKAQSGRHGSKNRGGSTDGRIAVPLNDLYGRGIITHDKP